MFGQKKTSSYDFSSDMLPKNRVEVFRDVLSLQWKKLLGLGLFLFLFSLPIQFFGYLKDVTISSIYSEYTQNQITLIEASDSLVSISNQYSLSNIFFILLLGLALSGIIRVIKRLAWAEPINGIPELFLGIKENGKQYVILFLLVGTLSYFATLISNLSTLVQVGGIYNYLGIIPKIVFIILFVPIALYVMITISIYSNSFMNQVRLGLYLYMSNIKKSIITILFLSSPFILLLFPYTYIHVIARIIIAFLFPILLLKWFLVSSDVLDKTWNYKHYPELVNKGILGVDETKEEKSRIRS